MDNSGIDWMAVATGIIPSVGVGIVFYIAYRAVTRADRSERKAQAELDAQD